MFIYLDFPRDSVVKNPPVNSGDVGSIPGLGRSPGEGNGNTLQYSCLGNPMDRGNWQIRVHGVTKKSNTTSGTHIFYLSIFGSAESPMLRGFLLLWQPGAPLAHRAQASHCSGISHGGLGFSSCPSWTQ